MTPPIRVLFVCVGNSARSLIAEALLRHMAPDRFEVRSAGTLPRTADPRALQALADMGIATDGLRSKPLSEVEHEDFDYLITLCDKSALECLALPHSGEVIAWNIEDPVTSTRINPFRTALQDIQERLKMFVLVKSKS